MKSNRASKKLPQASNFMWLKAASDVRSQIEELKSRIAKKRAAMRFFEESAANGDPWPGEEERA